MTTPPGRRPARPRASKPTLIPPAPPRGLVEVAAGGDRREILVALRAELALAVVVAQPREKAPLAGRLMDVIDRLDAIPVAKEADPVNEIAARAAAKRAAAAR